jgi:hypothetical protein
MNRRALVVTAAIVVPVVGLMTWALVAADTSSPGKPPALLGPGARPIDRAGAACRVVEKVMGFVEDNEDRDTVFAFLEVAKREIGLAAEGEPIYISLQSGIVSVDKGLREDDAGATELGIAIARDQCRRANVFLPGSVRPEQPSPEPTVTGSASP